MGEDLTIARIDPNGKRRGFAGRSLSMVSDTPVDSRQFVSLASKLLVWALQGIADNECFLCCGCP